LPFAIHGATFLRLRTVGELCTRAQHAAQRLALPAALVTSGLFAWTVAVAVDNNDKDAFPPILPAALGIAAVCLAVFFLMRRRTVLAFAMTAGGTIAVIATLFTSLYPSVMVSNPSSGNSLTVDGAASSHYSLEVMSIVALICVPLVLLYQGWTYHVFRHRVGDEPIRGDAAEEPIPPPQIEGEQRVSTNGSPKTLIVYYSLTKQTGRVVDAMASALEARGCHVTKALIEFLDQRYLPKLSEFPMKRPMLQIPVILPAQLRHKTGEIRIPPEAEAGDYDLVILASPTWWFQTSMPIRSYLESPAAKTVLNGKPFACASISRRYFSINLGQQKKLGEKNGGRWIDKTHFVVAGGQVKSMLSWLGYMKHGEPQERVMLLKMPPPNLQPDFEEQARSVVDGVADKALGPVAVPTS
jgi:menaquinone-dependent protoporphyrinogen IX oxidase